MAYDILALFVFVTLMICIAFDFSLHYAEKERQERYNKMAKYRRKPINITQERLDRVAKFYADWEAKQAERNNKQGN